MSPYIGYLFILISLSANGVVAKSLQCAQPECPAVNHGSIAETLLLPFPEDCNKFITCDNGVKRVESCPPELHFNPIGKICDWPENVKCVLCETETTETPTTEENTTTDEITSTSAPISTEASITPCELSECPELPDNKFIFLPVPWDCSQYIMCLNQQIYDLVCADGLIFSGEAQNCVVPSESIFCDQCELAVEITTLEPEVQTPSPCKVDECLRTQNTPLYLSVPWDCNKLILCIRGQTFEQTCAPGLIFSPADQYCINSDNEVCDVCEQIIVEESTTEIIELEPEPDTPAELCTEEISECSFLSIIVYYPVPWNCSQYASCSFGITTINDCAENKYFDVDAKLCVEESSCVACRQ